jgi:hypothetical protein
MKIRALISAVALVTTSLSPIAVTPAFATDISPDATTQPDDTMMDNYCDANFVTDDTHYVEAIPGSVVTGTTFEVANSREDVEETRVADLTSSFSYGGLETISDPLVRIGGSVNMWGADTFSEKIYSRSLVDQTALFAHRDAYNFLCRYWTDTITTSIITTSSTPDNPGLGNCVGDPNKKSAIDGVGPGKGALHADEHSACFSSQTIYTHNWTHADNPFTFYFTPEAIRDLAQHGVTENVPFTIEGSFSPPGVYSLACINPGKKGGTWTPKAKYTGGHCSTLTFNGAVTVQGRTFDDVPSASLPAF